MEDAAALPVHGGGARRHNHQLSLNARPFVPSSRPHVVVNPGQPAKMMARFDMADVNNEMFSNLNPSAEEFVPPSLSNPNGCFYFYGFGLIQSFIPANGGFNHSLIWGKWVYNNQGRSTIGETPAIRRTIFVSDIDNQVTEQQLAFLFFHCGQVVDCRICGRPNSILRFGFVEFTDAVSADFALTLSGTMLGRSRINITLSKTAIIPIKANLLPQNEDERDKCAKTIYCTNIDSEVSRAELKLFFETVCGQVLQMRLLGDPTHVARIAFVEFVRPESAIAALNCSGAILGCLPIRVCPSKTPVRPREPRASGP